MLEVSYNSEDVGFNLTVPNIFAANFPPLNILPLYSACDGAI